MLEKHEPRLVAMGPSSGFQKPSVDILGIIFYFFGPNERR